MYYYLGIVAQEDVLAGNFEPSYMLCQSHGKSENRSGWRVVKSNSVMSNMNKVLVKTLYGNDTMIQFMSHYRTRDHMHADKRYKHEKTKKYYPKGGLFWFGCNAYGERDGPAVFVKNVPDKGFNTDDGLNIVRRADEKVIPVKQVFSREPVFVDIEESCVKPKLYQERIPQGDYRSITM